jgi:hypothetical protein
MRCDDIEVFQQPDAGQCPGLFVAVDEEPLDGGKQGRETRCVSVRDALHGMAGDDQDVIERPGVLVGPRGSVRIPRGPAAGAGSQEERHDVRSVEHPEHS